MNTFHKSNLQTEPVSSFEVITYIGIQRETIVQPKEEIIVTLRCKCRAGLGWCTLCPLDAPSAASVHSHLQHILKHALQRDGPVTHLYVSGVARATTQNERPVTNIHRLSGSEGSDNDAPFYDIGTDAMTIVRSGESKVCKGLVSGKSCHLAAHRDGRN